ncbi:MAG: hypothetical protein K2O69_06340 [Odoribacter sp.]|nr:hypothetical protein [Odoribacter sp.]
MADSSESVRRGVLSAIYEYKNRNIIGGEILILAVLFGVYFSSWWIFGAVLIGGVLMLSIRILGILLRTVLTLAWGGIGLVLGMGLGSDAAGYVLAGIGFLLGYIVHFGIRR